MEDGRLKRSKRILIFNERHYLISIACSIDSVNKVSRIDKGAVSKLCNGHMVSRHGLYFRYLEQDIEVTIDDFGTLTVDEYDKMCGVQRKVRATKSSSTKKFTTT